MSFVLRLSGLKTDQVKSINSYYTEPQELLFFKSNLLPTFMSSLILPKFTYLNNKADVV